MTASPNPKFFIDAWLWGNHLHGSGCPGNYAGLAWFNGFCPEQGAFGICADFARDVEGDAQSGFYRVGASDLNRLMQNWLVKEAPAGGGVAGDCGGSVAP